MNLWTWFYEGDITCTPRLIHIFAHHHPTVRFIRPSQPSLHFREAVFSMKLLPTTLLVVISTFMAPVMGCRNAACEFVELHARRCSFSNAYAACLCSERFKVNYSRCMRGMACAWDGVSDPNLGACTAMHCKIWLPDSEAYVETCGHALNRKAAIIYKWS